jgi:hypothetical protein
MKLLIELPEHWGPEDLRDVASKLRSDTLPRTDRLALAEALDLFIDVDVLMESVRKS